MHVHSTFSDGRNTLEENVAQAERVGLRALRCVDHVRTDTKWVPTFTAAVCGWMVLGSGCSARPESAVLHSTTAGPSIAPSRRNEPYTIARPFEWTFSRTMLDSVIEKITHHQPVALAA
jgi:hypothetical protein